MYPQYAKAQAGRTASHGDLGDRVQIGMKIHLPAAAEGRLYHAERSGGSHVGDMFVRLAVQHVGLRGAYPQ